MVLHSIWFFFALLMLCQEIDSVPRWYRNLASKTIVYQENSIQHGDPICLQVEN